MAPSENTFHKLFDLSGQVAVVTGANGILGRQHCAALAEFGARVVVIDLDQAASAAHAAELSAAYGAPAVGLALDIASEQAVAQAIAAIERDVGPIDILINNAASKGSSLSDFFAATENYSMKTWREISAVNVDGAFLMAREVGTRMAARGKGSIVNVASIYGVVGPDQRIYEGSEYLGMPINTPAVYAATKAAIVGLTRYLATLWAAQGVRVNALTPGGVESGQNDVFLQRYSARTPLGRMAKQHEISGAVVYLASEASSYVTGHNLVVDGGWSVW
jgi:NAD(P)-dependent dehydrogenase (short-subunit alcohol dehydrogenase family)